MIQEWNHRTIFVALRDDLRTMRPFQSLRKEAKAIREFYLTPDQREQLKRMKHIKRLLFFSAWVLRAMFFRLTPFRRLLFVVAIFFTFSVQTTVNNEITINGNNPFGGFLLVLLILLELKDKLLAHDELKEGRHIQQLLMPEQTPHIDGWSAWLYTRSANEVCGDLIDFLRMDNGRIGIAIADVAGKGLHAALLTAKLQSTLRALAFDEPSPSRLVSRVNTIFHRDSPAHLFASLFYVELIESTPSIHYVNAGHLPALTIRNGTIEETNKGDAALGLMRTVSYTAHHTTLNNGNLFVLYSDGLTEAKNEQGEFFGKERLFKLLQTNASPEQIGNSILREIDRFIEGTMPSDDLSLVILQKK